VNMSGEWDDGAKGRQFAQLSPSAGSWGKASGTEEHVVLPHGSRVAVDLE
jgi:hypothetical protein